MLLLSNCVHENAPSVSQDACKLRHIRAVHNTYFNDESNADTMCIRPQITFQIFTQLK